MVHPESVPAIQLHRHLGATRGDGPHTQFCVWAPTSRRVDVELVDSRQVFPMEKSAGGYHQAIIDGIAEGGRYCYRFDGQSTGRPDPVSRSQPDGVHGPSAVVDHPSYRWEDADWTGIPRSSLIIYELHLGAFTDEGTFSAAIERLDELVDLGITAIELMPVADAAGRWNWGYDGVCLFAPNHNYGSPDQLRQLVDAAHRRGLAVILDVVYNHVGPEGNYLAECGPYLSKRHTTAWGDAPNFDDPDYGRELRRIFVANAIYWFDEFHIDGLRVDAIHCMRDDSPTHIAAEISRAARDWSRATGRPAMLIAESNVYDPNMIDSPDEGGIGFDAEWCDDFLHSVFAVVRPGEHLCHREYRREDLDQTLRYGYVYEGTLRDQRGRQRPTERVATDPLVYSIQHHDFIGNHPLGRRLHQLTSLETQRAAIALLLLSPAIPMLFMGEEFACEHPFQFFVDFNDQHLRQAVVEGRKREYPQHDWSDGRLPTDSESFIGSKIGPADQGNDAMRCWYQSLIRLRKQWIQQGLIADQNFSVETEQDKGMYVVRYQSRDQTATVVVRLNELSRDVGVIDWDVDGEVLLDSRDPSDPRPKFHPNHAKVLLER